MSEPELAPATCIVCGQAHPGGENVPGWIYLAGSTPLGAVACSDECGKVAIARHVRTGRVDTKGRRQ
jgi:predicted nucleic acid-binding Zn ribbon protein